VYDWNKATDDDYIGGVTFDIAGLPHDGTIKRFDEVPLTPMLPQIDPKDDAPETHPPQHVQGTITVSCSLSKSSTTDVVVKSKTIGFLSLKVHLPAPAWLSALSLLLLLPPSTSLSRPHAFSPSPTLSPRSSVSAASRSTRHPISSPRSAMVSRPGSWRRPPTSPTPTLSYSTTSSTSSSPSRSGALLRPLPLPTHSAITGANLFGVAAAKYSRSLLLYSARIRAIHNRTFAILPALAHPDACSRPSTWSPSTFTTVPTGMPFSGVPSYASATTWSAPHRGSAECARAIWCCLSLYSRNADVEVGCSLAWLPQLGGEVANRVGRPTARAAPPGRKA